MKSIMAHLPKFNVHNMNRSDVIYEEGRDNYEVSTLVERNEFLENFNVTVKRLCERLKMYIILHPGKRLECKDCVCFKDNKDLFYLYDKPPCTYIPYCGEEYSGMCVTRMIFESDRKV